jgi:hypothetical protein
MPDHVPRLYIISLRSKIAKRNKADNIFFAGLFWQSCKKIKRFYHLQVI